MRNARLLPLAYLPLALFWLWPLATHPAALPYRPGAEYSDLTISHWPNAEFLRRSLAETGRIPLWNPNQLGGQPFAADPLAGLYYPPNWTLALPFLPLTVGFNLLFALHLAWAGWGLYRFLRALALSPGAAFFGGLAFAGAPKLVAHIGAGHLSLVFAVCWTPWLLLAVHRADDLRRGALAGAVLALIFLADPRWAPFAAALASGYYLTRRRDLRPLLALGLFALALSAALALPLIEFAARSTRAALTPAETAAYSLPPLRLLGLLLADPGGFYEFQLYPGAMTLILAGSASLTPARRRPGGPRPTLFFAVAFALALSFSLGPTGLLQPLAVRLLPGVSLLRVPARALFAALLSLAVLAACGLETVRSGAAPRAARLASLALVGFAALALLLPLGYALRIGPPPSNLLRLALAGLPSALLTLFLLRRPGSSRIPPAHPAPPSSSPPLFRPSSFLLPPSLPPILLASLPILLLADQLSLTPTLLEARPQALAFAAGQEAARFLAAQRGPFRVYSPSYSLPQHVAAEFGLAQADGVNPLQLAEAVAAMGIASGVAPDPAAPYSVTLPPFPVTGDPATANAAATPNARALGLLNVEYVLSAFPLQAEGLAARGVIGGAYLYRNGFARPRAWLAYRAAGGADRAGMLAAFARGELALEGAGLAGPPGGFPIGLEKWSPDEIRLRVAASGPGVAVASGIGFPGWSAWLDGSPVPLEVVSLALRGVRVGPGEHRVVFRFRPLSVYWGLGITLAGLAGLGALWRRG